MLGIKIDNSLCTSKGRKLISQAYMYIYAGPDVYQRPWGISEESTESAEYQFDNTKFESSLITDTTDNEGSFIIHLADVIQIMMHTEGPYQKVIGRNSLIITDSLSNSMDALKAAIKCL